MKTQIVLTPKELENTDYSKFIITIKLADECKNGHDDFSIMAEDWYKGSNNKDIDCGGCMHEEILKFKPELKIFVDLHLCDFNGVPMYAVNDGYYWLNKDKQTAIEYLRITETEYALLYNTMNKLEFSGLIHSLGINKRWKFEADYAIKTLEEMTGETYVNHSINSHLYM